ncbi:MAG TPA: sulfotransferase [Solirubrobacterales bacterium]|jgi:hypothetical protein|nr:sulfotransferase [Solirubrobacterales bacterium]
MLRPLEAPDPVTIRAEKGNVPEGDTREVSVTEPGRLAWIFGSSRSGSTWLLRMLSELERVIPIDDPHIGHHLGVWRPIPLAWATAKDPPKLGTLADFKRKKRDYLFSDRYRDTWVPQLRELISARFEAQAAQDMESAGGIDDPIVVVKEPGSHAADTIMDLFPESSLIFLLRDGRDVVDSWLDAYKDGSWATDEGAYPLDDTGRPALIRWQSSVWLHRTEVVQETYARTDPERRVLIRYEEMRDEPIAALQKIAAMLGLDATREQLEEIAGTHAFSAVPTSDKGAGREIRRADPGGWADHMSRDEIVEMHQILAKKLDELGYLRPGDVPKTRRAA